MQIIGQGRVGGALVARAEARKLPVAAVSRTAGWQVLDMDGGPVMVATRNDDLDGVLARVPVARRKDLVFVQNGMLRDWLADRDLAGATRGLLFFAVATRGAALQPGPPSPFVGPHAQAVVDWLRSVEVPAEVVSPEAFAALEAEKLLWNVIFGLLCEAYDLPVGALVKQKHHEVRDLTAELLPLIAARLDVQVPLEPLVESLCAYSEQIPAYKGAVKAWPWRNGWFVTASRAAGISTPVHDALLRRIGRVGGREGL